MAEPGAERLQGTEHVPALLAPPERVLATLNQDGTRRWIRPRCSDGRFLTWRRRVGWALMVIFVALPWVSVGGKPAVLLDVLRREFTLFGTTFVPTDTPLLMLFLLSVFAGVFLLTALFGRVWCGWACPQTVYMELLFRPLEAWFEGSYQQQQKLDREGGGPRRALKNVVFALIAAFLAHTFLAYFVGWRALIGWMTGSPFAHPVAFLVMGLTTLAMCFDFLWFREQTCLVACPYGRFQSVLLDRDSLIVGYDAARGEPRAKLKKARTPLPVVAATAATPAVAGAIAEAAAAPARGDCVDCGACVTTCPTGIDIRDGLQLECIGCAQCIDACDAIMTRLGRPTGLVRYDARARLEEGREPRALRPRTAAYSLILLVAAGLLTLGVLGRSPAKVSLLRGSGAYQSLPGGEISNGFRLRVRNQSGAPRRYRIELEGVEGARLVAPENPLEVAPGELRSAEVFVVLPRGAYRGAGERAARFRVSDGEGFSAALPATLLGPKE